jgi:hypothetical protein
MWMYCLVSFKEFIKTSVSGRGSWFLLHDYTRPHNAVSIKQFLAKQGILELNHPLPNIFLIYPHQTFFLFHKIKCMLKRRRFENKKDRERNVTKELLALHTNEFHKCFQQFYERAQKCVTSHADYFEEY